LRAAVVAGKLALDAETAFDPVEDGIQREEDEADLLNKVGPVVAAAEMLELVQENLLELLRGESLEQGKGEKDSGAVKADDAGAVDVLGDAELRRAGCAVQQGAAGGLGDDGRGGRGDTPEMEGAAEQPRSTQERESCPGAEDQDAPAGVEMERADVGWER